MSENMLFIKRKDKPKCCGLKNKGCRWTLSATARTFSTPFRNKTFDCYQHQQNYQQQQIFYFCHAFVL